MICAICADHRDPDCPESRCAIGHHCQCVRGIGWCCWCGRVFQRNPVKRDDENSPAGPRRPNL